MAYSDSGVVRIDRDAATADMRKLASAMERLSDSCQTINQLINCAEGMTGQTGSSIREKAEEMRNKIDRLYNNLSVSRDLIDTVVKKYQNKDTSLASFVGTLRR